MSMTFPMPSAVILSPRRAVDSAGPSRPGGLSYLAVRAEARGIFLNNLVNELLRKDIELIEAAR